MEDKKKLRIYYGLLITLVILIGVSYAWFRLTLKQSNSNVIGTRSCLDATLTEETSKITLSDAFPISDEDGLKQSPFTFTLKNNCESYIKVYITIDSKYRESTDTSYLKDSFLKVNLSSKGTTDSDSVMLGSQTLTDLESGRKGYILVTTGLKANEEKSYDLRVWMDSETSISDGLNKNWEGKIVVVGVAANEENTTLVDTILANNEVATPLTTPGTAISTENEALLASTEDDYGTSYYFRGAVTNNYVQFANKCWRIVRIAGDNSVKLVLHNDNTSNAANPCSATNNSDTAAFAHYNGDTYKSDFNSKYDSSDYVGFMYGTGNSNKSTILTNLETWYANNLTAYENKLADTVWCNDKSKVSDSSFDPWGFTGNPLGTVVYYNATQRLASSSGTAGGTGPSLKCNGDTSKITLKYGLLTADEVAYAGSILNSSNSSMYLSENAGHEYWWTMSPSYYNGEFADVWLVLVGALKHNSGVYMNDAVRPSISLVSSSVISGGTGTSEDPYIVD